MTTIKVESGVTDSVTNFNSKIDTYQQAVVSAVAGFSEFQGILEGKSYESLITQTNSVLETQKVLVAECLTLSQKLNSFVEEITEAEANVSFE
ncbi:hypothetical protein AALH12_03180 [Streptococcus ferus]|uniref:hypothetical protein n=1 Tax=Streptococcus ferus TaxID=1345 RepID=UPI003517E61F